MKRWLFIGGTVALLAIAYALLEFRSPFENVLEEVALLALGEDTVFSPDYDDARFSELSLGDSMEGVLEKLGEPFSRTSEGTGTMLHYAQSTKSGQYRARRVFIVDGVVHSIIACLDQD